jgi:hypothetical protein
VESFRALAATVHRGSESAGPHVGLYQSRYGLLGAADAVWCSFGDHTHSTRQGLAAEASLFTDRYHCNATATEDSVCASRLFDGSGPPLKSNARALGALSRTLAHTAVSCSRALTYRLSLQSGVRSSTESSPQIQRGVHAHVRRASSAFRLQRVARAACWRGAGRAGSGLLLKEQHHGAPSGINHVSKRVTSAPMHVTTVRARVC